jgi:hypothetical protein
MRSVTHLSGPTPVERRAAERSHTRGVTTVPDSERAYTFTHLADRDLDHTLATTLGEDRATTATLLALIAEFDARRLFVPAGHPSMHSYCVDVLHLSDDAAYRRITAARAARDFPAIFTAVAEGRLHLTAIGLLAPYLTHGNADELLKAAEHQGRDRAAHRAALPEDRDAGDGACPAHVAASDPR